MQLRATAVLLGQVTALEVLGTTLIASHPDPVGALAAWEEVKSHVIEDLMRNGGPYLSSDFREAFHAQLARFETAIRTASDLAD